MKNDEIEILRELVDELNFARQFLTNDQNYQKIKDLNKKIEELEKKLDETKIHLDGEFFDKFKKDIEEKREKILSLIEDEIRLYKNAAKDFENSKNYLINVLAEIKEENKKIRKDISVFNKVHLVFTSFIFAAAAGIGYYFGCYLTK